MREKEFMEMAKQEILRQLPEDVRAGLSLKEVKVVKINDQKNHGFCFQKNGSKASPTLYLDQAYDLFRHGASLERLMGDVTRAYLESIDRGLDSADEYSGVKSITCPAIGNHHSGQTEISIPEMEITNILS